MNLRSAIAIGLPLSLASVFFAHSVLNSSSSNPTSLESIADAAFAEGETPGFAILEARSGVVLNEVVRGVRRVGGDPVQVGDQWHLGSDGKAITATMIARLVERGVLSWDMPLPQLLPSLAPVLQPSLRDSTLLDLVTHRSGVAENPARDFVQSFHHSTASLPEQRLQYLRRALTDTPAVERGRFQYSNAGYVAAAAAAEHATGRSFEELMQQEIFGPLGLKTAGFGVPAEGQPQGHEAGTPHSGWRGDNPRIYAPAGGMHMSLRDWATFALDQMAGERGRGKLLKEETYRFLHQPVTTHKETGVALGWGVRQETFGPLLSHSGSNLYWYALIGMAPARGNLVLVVANAGEDARADKVTSTAYRAVVATWRGTE